MRRLAAVAALLLAGIGAALAGCGDGTETVTETRTETGPPPTETTGTTAATTTTVEGNHGPRYFQTPSRNIGCYVDSSAARCDIRERDWSPPPEPAFCRKAGLDYGQGIVVGKNRAEFVCAGDTALGGKATLAYGQSSQRGPFRCESAESGITCTNTANGRGFFLSRQSYRMF